MRPGQPQLHPQLNGSLDLDGAFGERAMCRTALSSRFVAAAALAKSSVVPCFYHLAPPWWCPCRSQHWQTKLHRLGPIANSSHSGEC